MRAISLLLLIPASTVFAANILSNEGFESGSLAPSSNADDFCGCQWIVDTGDAHTGSFSAFVNGSRVILQSVAPTPTERITEVSFWARHVNASLGAAVAVVLDYSDGSRDNTVFASTQSGDWEFIDVTSWLDPGKSLVAFGISGNPSPSIIETRLDDVRVDAIPEPGSLLLAPGGLLLLGLRALRMRSACATRQ